MSIIWNSFDDHFAPRFAASHLFSFAWLEGNKIDVDTCRDGEYQQCHHMLQSINHAFFLVFICVLSPFVAHVHLFVPPFLYPYVCMSVYLRAVPDPHRGTKGHQRGPAGTLVVNLVLRKKRAKKKLEGEKKRINKWKLEKKSEQERGSGREERR